jgi:periplasmic divalent cation tolerance protein
MTEFIVVFITAPCEDDAATMARELVGAGLAGCVSIIPGVRSIYRWEGKTEDHAEVLMIAKTRAGNFDALMKRVKELHSYHVPEIVALPLLEGSPDYLAWLRGVTVHREIN